MAIVTSGVVEYCRKYYSGKCECCCNCTRKYYIIFEIVFFIVSILSFLLSIIWLYCWSVLNNLSSLMEEFVFHELSVWIPLFAIIFVFTILAGLYLSTLVTCGLVLIRVDKPLYMAVCHKVGVAVCCGFCIAVIVTLDVSWPGKDYWQTIRVSLEISSPFLQLCALIIWVFFSIYVSALFYNTEKALKFFLLAGYFTSLFLRSRSGFIHHA